jgi:hypothetical protein
MDEPTIALGSPEHPRRCRAYRVVPWKYAFEGTSIAIEVAKEEKSAKRIIGAK